MGSTITNIAALRAANRFNSAMGDLGRSMERLATGKRINRASDDPAGVAAVTPMKSRIEDLKSGLKALDQTDAYYGAVEGARSVISDQLIELKGLVVTAASRGALSASERDALQIQARGILDSIDFASNTATFKGQQILAGQTASTYGAMLIDVKNKDGTTSPRNVSLASLRDVLNLVDGDTEAADKVVSAAIQQLATTRAAAGAIQNENESKRRTMLSELENVSDAASKIEDVDYAKETATAVRSKLLADVSGFMTRVAGDTNRELVLGLIKGIKAA